MEALLYIAAVFGLLYVLTVVVTTLLDHLFGNSPVITDDEDLDEIDQPASERGRR